MNSKNVMQQTSACTLSNTGNKLNIRSQTEVSKNERKKKENKESKIPSVNTC